MTADGLLTAVRGAALVRRARWILALRELQHQAGTDRTWCTLHEWLRCWPSDAEDGRGADLEEATAKRQRHRLQEALRELHLELLIETPEGEGLRIHVASGDLRDLVSLEEREARVAVETAEAHAAGREPELDDEDPDPREVAQKYGNGLKHLHWLARKHGRSVKVIRKLLLAQGVVLRPAHRTKVEHCKPAATLEKALGAAARGESARVVGRILGVSRFTAWRFAQRNGVRRPKA